MLLTLCSGFGLLTALLTTKEYELYSKDFDELNAQTEERINQILQHATASRKETTRSDLCRSDQFAIAPIGVVFLSKQSTLRTLERGVEIAPSLAAKAECEVKVAAYCYLPDLLLTSFFHPHFRSVLKFAFSAKPNRFPPAECILPRRISGLRTPEDSLAARA